VSFFGILLFIIILLTIHVLLTIHSNVWININNEMNIPIFYRVISHAGYYHILLQSLRYFLENFYDRTALYWTPLVKLSRESAFTRWYRLRFHS